MGTSMSKETEDELWGRNPTDTSREMDKRVRKASPSPPPEPTLEDKLWGRDNNSEVNAKSRSRRLKEILNDDGVEVDLKEESDNPEDWDPKTAGPIFPNGEINWDCPCLGNAAHGPCGTEFRGAFSCFIESKEDPKGADCLVQFREMQACFTKYPELYAKDDDDDDDELGDFDIPNEEPRRKTTSTEDDDELDEVAEELLDEEEREKEKRKTSGARRGRRIKEAKEPVVAGIISLLDEPHADLKHFALKKLNKIVNEFWPEISDSIIKIESLTEDEEYPQDQRELAALVASKVYYHLGAFEESLKYALGAGTLFTGQLTRRDEYVETILAKCLDKYIHLRADANPDDPSSGNIDPNLTSIVNKMFEQCFQDKQYKQALGIAIETRRMDMFRRAIPSSDEQEAEMLAYAFRVVMGLVGQRAFRDKLLGSLVGLYAGLTKPDNISRCQCLIFLDDHLEAAKLLVKLSKDEENRLMAYQIAFDLYESATQNFLGRVMASLYQLVGHYLPDSPEKPPEEPTDEAVEVKSSTTQIVPVTDEIKEHWKQLVKILSGEVSIALQLQFLVRSNKCDLTILKQTKEAVRVSICHTGTVIANAYMHCGTTSDQFLRENLDWLARATNWAKFTATASLGVIHHGHEKEALVLMQSYLPRESGGATAGYSEGGALFALGLIHANHGTAMIDYLIRQLTSPTLNEMIGHGACIGLGLAAMGTARKEVYDILHTNLNKDDAVIGEAAGIAMGLVMLGSLDEAAIKNMVDYARETQHEKILRGLALGISLLTFGKLESADTLIEELLHDKDALLRRAGVLSVAMAYCGSASNSAIQKLLKVAVSDVNDDVRRAAVIGLGFLLFRAPEQCPNVVSLLAESYNPHVRYGAALAIGIACSGSGNKEALALIEPLTQDPVNYVRQGALIASAMVLIQQTEVLCPKVKDFRALYNKVLNDKHDDVMAKFGAVLAQGIIDGGGRNVTVTLSSRTGHVWLQGAVGMLLFTHYWYWFPMSLCLGLSFAPTCMIAVNKQLMMPVLQFKSNAKPSTFAYPPPLEERKKEEKERVATAILSVTAKAKRREAEKAKAAGGEPSKTEEKVEKMEVDEEKEKEKAAEDKKEKEKEVKKEEPLFEMLDNPARVMKQQLRYIELPEDKDASGVSQQRWEAVKDLSSGGIIVVRDKKSSEPIDIVRDVAACGPQTDDEENEPEPPEEFEYVEEED